MRASLAQFTPGAVAAHLHDKAHEGYAQRLWGAFLGRRHSIVTSWLGLGVYAVDFGGGGGGRGERPRYVEGVMPNVDGCVQMMEAGLEGAVVVGSGRGRWYRAGVSVSLYLQADVMQSVLADPAMRRYRGQWTECPGLKR